MEQRLLFSLENYLDINPLHNYQLLFNNLPAIPITHLKSTGRKPIPREAILKGLIFRNLKSIPSLTELNKEFLDNPSAALRCGFNLNNIPTVERFSSFLRDTPSTELVNIRNFLVEQLFSLGIIEGKYLSIDSCTVPAKVKENNLKTNVINRFNKMRIPKGDPDARLGV